MKLEELQVDIISFLLDEKTTTIAEISQSTGASNKTISKYIELINDVFDKEGLMVRITTKRGVGVKIEGDLKKLNKKIRTLGYYVNDTEQDRITFIYSQLLNINGYITIQELSEKMFVSRTTVEKLLKSVKRNLKKLNVHLIADQNGLILEENEEKKRKLMSEVLSYYWSGISTTSDLELNAQLDSDASGIVDNKVFKTVFKVLGEFINENQYTITDYEYQTLAIHLAIAISRISHQFYIDKANGFSNNVSAKTIDLVEILEKKFSISFPEVEKQYIDIYINLFSNNQKNKHESLQKINKT
ncbi:BglG family transcription antiterminator [Pisciglobus halotolerans]|uniref:HTH domain-containing protein n=1 Tax=Pisciglobus halotolerans TaxID=745365 RepID=A0A1I3DPQ5_9LACT|nr:HTH domain-containing protein [Pisciglobus halotolerans]SFH88715.1 HTH domain-containing protein [Pisciglobus halotolerans]